MKSGNFETFSNQLENSERPHLPHPELFVWRPMRCSVFAGRFPIQNTRQHGLTCFSDAVPTAAVKRQTVDRLFLVGPAVFSGHHHNVYSLRAAEERVETVSQRGTVCCLRVLVCRMSSALV